MTSVSLPPETTDEIPLEESAVDVRLECKASANSAAGFTVALREIDRACAHILVTLDNSSVGLAIIVGSQFAELLAVALPAADKLQSAVADFDVLVAVALIIRKNRCFTIAVSSIAVVVDVDSVAINGVTSVTSTGNALV